MYIMYMSHEPETLYWAFLKYCRVYLSGRYTWCVIRRFVYSTRNWSQYKHETFPVLAWTELTVDINNEERKQIITFETNTFSKCYYIQLLIVKNKRNYFILLGNVNKHYMLDTRGEKKKDNKEWKKARKKERKQERNKRRRN